MVLLDDSALFDYTAIMYIYHHDNITRNMDINLRHRSRRSWVIVGSRGWSWVVVASRLTGALGDYWSERQD